MDLLFSGPSLPHFRPPEGTRNLRSAKDLGFSRGDSTCTFVTEFLGRGLVRQVFPQTLLFQGDQVLRLVQPGIYRKHRKAADRG